MKRTLWAVGVGLVGLGLAAAALAQLSKYRDWSKSAEAYFLTAAEKQAWGNVRTDEEAEKFIAGYWAKRDPNPATTANEFRDDVSRRIAAADEQFKMRNRRGSETARGRLLVTLGLPTRVTSQRAAIGGMQEERDVQAVDRGTAPNLEQATAVTQTWHYAKDKFDPSLGIGEMRVRVNVDPQRGTDDLVGAGAVDKAIAKIADKTIVTPSATAPVAGTAPSVPPAATGPTTTTAPSTASAPSTAPATGAAGAAPKPAPAVPPGAPPPAAPAATGAPAAAAPAAATAALPAEVQTALSALGKESKLLGSFWSGEFRSTTGDPFYALQFYVPADQAAQPLKFGGIVWNDANQSVGTYWEDATFVDVKSGTRTDKVFDKSVALPAGSYRGSFGLFPASGGAPVATASSTFKLESRAGEFAVSPLILANTLTPLTKRPGPTDPFVFGTEKPIKVEPKGDRKFAKEDSLWYFYAISNPTLSGGSTAPAATPAPATTPGAAAAAPAAAEPKPRVMTRISVLRDGQNAFQPLTSPAELQVLGPGYYATGSEIPLTSFEPGYYTFAIHVRDMNAAKDSAAYKGIERKEDFVVLNADGSMPAKAAAKPKAPAKKG